MSSFKDLLGLEFIKFAGENNLKKVQACLDLEVDVNASGNDGATAAHRAAIRVSKGGSGGQEQEGIIPAEDC